MNKKQVVSFIITTAALLTMLFATKVNAVTGTVTTETLNLRSQPTIDSSIIELLSEFDEIEILGEENGWYKVKHNDNEGYVSAEYVKKEENASEPEPQTPETNNSEPIDQNENGNVTQKTVTLAKDTSIKILPLINSQQLGTINAGTTVNVISQTNKWIFVETEQITGWIAKNTIVTEQNTGEGQQTETPKTSENETQETEQNEEESQTQEENNQEQNVNENNYETPTTKYVNASSIYVRSQPSTSSDILTSLIRNTDVIVTGESGDWYKVKYGDFSGYIYKELLSDTKAEETNRGGIVDRNSEQTEQEEQTKQPETSDTNQTEGQETQSSTSSIGEQIAQYAKQYLGCPYVYGGSGPKTFDCSGFTMYVYSNFGYSLSHSATAQSKLGTYVEKENLQPGDLVFFLDYETMDGIGHCGIYIGDGNFIHASSGTGYCVKISTLTSGSYLNRYATARRLI